MIERHNLKIAVVDLIELLHMGSVGSLDMAIELRGARRQDEKPDTSIFTGLFESRLELWAAIHLKGFDRERHPRKEGVQESGSSVGGSSAVGLQDIPPTYHVSGSEVLEDNPGQRAYVQGIHLNHVSGLFHRVIPGLAHCVGTGALAAAC
jgi:hypothetical protein